MKSLLVAALVFGLASPALAQQAQSAGKSSDARAPAAAAPKDDPNKLICEMIKPTDSNIRRRVCKTQAQLEKERDDAKRYMDAKQASQGAPQGISGN